MPARLTHVADRINLQAQRMHQAHAVDALNALAPLLRVRPEVQLLCRFGAQWAADHAAEFDRWAPFHCVTHGACVVELSDLGREVPLAESAFRAAGRSRGVGATPFSAFPLRGARERPRT